MLNPIIGTVSRAVVGAVLVVPVIVGTADAAPMPCAQTWQAPHSHTAAVCRSHGWTIRPRLVVDARGYVRHDTLPHCTEEDGSSGPLPCTWNVGPGTDGNGIGLAYWLDRSDRTHYVRGTR